MTLLFLTNNKKYHEPIFFFSQTACEFNYVEVKKVYILAYFK